MKDSPNNLPSLSEETKLILKEAYDLEDKHDFYNLILSLRKKNWPLRAMADALNVSRTAVQNWERKADPDKISDSVEELPQKIDAQIRPLYSKFVLSKEQASSLLALAKKAALVRKNTLENAPEKLAAKELEQLLMEYKEQGCSLSQLARVCHVSRRAIAQRLEKYV